MIKLIRYTLISALLLTLPMGSYAADSDFAAFGYVDVSAADVQIVLTGSSLRIVGGQGQQVEVYNVTGVRVFARHIDSNDQTFQHSLPRGCYMVKVGNTVRKVSIR